MLTISYIFLDFETAYSSKDKYSLKHMTYEQYIRDDNFRVHGLGYKIDDQETKYVYGQENIKSTICKLFPPGNNHTAVAHNMLFDGAILSWVYNVTAARYHCTESMSRAIWNQYSAALEQVVIRCYPNDETKRKGKELENFDGKLYELSHEEQKALGSYCKNDVTLTFDIYAMMYRWLPEIAFQILDLSLAAFVNPLLFLDRQRVEKYLLKVVQDTNEAVEQAGISQTILSSNDKFAQWILDQGIKFEKIPSPTPKNPHNTKWPLAKDAPEFLDLQASHPEHAKVWDARLKVKSTIERTRAQRLLDHAQVSHINPDGKIALPLTFCSAHTKRFGGTNKINPQNFKRGSELRKSLCSDTSHLVAVADSSNIEARDLAYLSDQTDLSEVFADESRDVYAEFASDVYKRPIDKEKDPLERFVGKVCILGLGYGVSAKTLRRTLASGSMGPKVHITMQEAVELVYLYRHKYAQIVKFWKFLDRMLLGMCQEGFQHEHKNILFEYQRIILPNGMIMNYPELTGHENENKNGYDFRYWNGKFYKKIYGAAFAENITQAHAQAILWQQMVWIAEEIQPTGRIILQVHDEIISILQKELAEDQFKIILCLMRTVPEWCNDGGLVLAAEGGLATNYSK